MTDTTPARYRDENEAYILFRTSGNGFSGMQYILARMYMSGIGVERNAAQARYWFENAAEGGDADAQFILGLLYSAGRGAPRDLVLAYKWFNLAAAKGFES
jgi:uncharacterized protein